MFNETYELKDLWDTKNAELRNKCLELDENGCGLISDIRDSAFIGPVLWEESLTISDLDNINLEEFSPRILEDTDGESLQFDSSVVDSEPVLNTPIKQTDIQLDHSFRQFSSDAHYEVFSDLPVDQSYLSEPKLKKQPRSRIPVEQKNEKYWNRRMKNNASAKRSRDARRMMENQVYLKASLLEQENYEMKIQLNRLINENNMLRQLLKESSLTLPAITESPNFVTSRQPPDRMVALETSFQSNGERNRYCPIKPKPIGT